MRCYFVDCFFSFSFFFFHFLIFSHFFHLLIFLFFYSRKNGTTPLFIAAFEGHEQIVQILLEKGKANVDLANEVLFC